MVETSGSLTKGGPPNGIFMEISVYFYRIHQTHQFNQAGGKLFPLVTIVCPSALWLSYQDQTSSTENHRKPEDAPAVVVSASYRHFEGSRCDACLRK